MNQIRRNVRLVIDCGPIRTGKGVPMVIVHHAYDPSWVPDPVDGGTRCVVDVEIPMNVLFDETELPPIVASEAGKDVRCDC